MINCFKHIICVDVFTKEFGHDSLNNTELHLHLLYKYNVMYTVMTTQIGYCYECSASYKLWFFGWGEYQVML